MDLIFACGICGGDPATDSFVLQSALAAVISAPYLLRTQIAGLMRRMRGQQVGQTSAHEGAACSLQMTDDDQNSDDA